MKSIPHNIDDCWNQKGVWGATTDRCEQLEVFGHCRNCPIYGATGRVLLDRSMPDEYREELIQRYKSAPPTVEVKDKSAFVFMAGGEWLALHAHLVKEVVHIGPIHSIPHKNSRIFRGITNIGGHLEICASIGGLLRIGKRYRHVRGQPTAERLIVAEKEHQKVVFPVTEVRGIVRYNDAMLLPLPVTLSGSKAVYTKKILSLRDRDIGFLDDAILFRVLTRNIA